MLGAQPQPGSWRFYWFVCDRAAAPRYLEIGPFGSYCDAFV